MFTGIIEEIGKVKAISRWNQGYQIEFITEEVINDMKQGDSIAVNGVCLTVTKITGKKGKSFLVDVMPETLSKTNLGKLRVGSFVNLERSLSITSRFGGHFVSGHVDGVGTIKDKRNYKNAVIYSIEVPINLLIYIIPKGSVTVDGISLTVINTDDRYFEVSIVPYTFKKTILHHKKPGDTVNIECDIISKYIKHFLEFDHEKLSIKKYKISGLSKEFLLEHGFK